MMRLMVLLAGFAMFACGDKAPAKAPPAAGASTAATTATAAPAEEGEPESAVADKAIAEAKAEITSANAADEAARLEAEIQADQD
jgi:predicted small lipoprotein YifL